MTYACYAPGGPNLSKTLVSPVFSSIFTLMSTPTLNHCPKPQKLTSTMGLMRFIYVRSMAFKSTSKFLSGSRLVFGSILFVADKMGDLSLKELKLWEITGSDTDHFPPTSAQVGLTCEARLGHGSSQLGESESDPSGDNCNHHEICCPDVADPIYKPSLESKSDGGPKVFMVGKANPPANQTNAEIARAAEAEIARVAQLA
jgi:hypothetical protein